MFDIDLACASGAGTEDELLDAVDEGVAHAVLETVGTGGSTYSFTHSLLVNAVTQTINARRLSRIHERVAGQVRNVDAGSDDGRHAARAGQHRDVAGHAARGQRQRAAA